MKRIDFMPPVAVVCVIGLLVVLFFLVRGKAECERSGGHYVRGFIGMECVK